MYWFVCGCFVVLLVVGCCLRFQPVDLGGGLGGIPFACVGFVVLVFLLLVSAGGFCSFVVCYLGWLLMWFVWCFAILCLVLFRFV